MVELLLVLTVIAMFAGVASIRFANSFDYPKLQHAADQMICDLQLVRDQARVDHQSYTFFINTDDRSYQALGVESLNHQQDISVNLADEPFGLSNIICESGSDHLLMFDPDGTIDEPASIILKRGDKQITIEITTQGRITQLN